MCARIIIAPCAHFCFNLCSFFSSFPRSDVNECSLRNGHGPCQGACLNTRGSYRCSCDDMPGTQLAPDGHACQDIDECRVNNGGCSHSCLNTLGSAFCACPEGYMLADDWKTCEGFSFFYFAIFFNIFSFLSKIVTHRASSLPIQRLRVERLVDYLTWPSREMLISMYSLANSTSIKRVGFYS